MKKAAIYLRSSKDRSDVSIAAQRRELEALAQTKGLNIVHEYADIVESAKSINRPQFQAMLSGLKEKDRSWDTLLLLDTARLSRRRFHAQAFKHQATKHGVNIIYAKMPDLDPITSVIVESVFEAMDEVHSLMSKEKGLAGMAENVRQGYRAGGRAPYGYTLKKIETGAVRDGAPVTKSILKVDPLIAPQLTQFLQARAAGVSRTLAQDDAGIRKPKSSMIGIEWNALTYAGSTVWNVHNEKADDGGYIGGVKRRPREEWVIQENTHEALITQHEAEQILYQLQHSASKRRPRSKTVYLLSGLLKDSSEQAWHGDGGTYYAIKHATSKKRIRKDQIEEAVMNKIGDDLMSDDFVASLLAAAKKHAKTTVPDESLLLKKRLQKVSSEVSKLVQLSLEMSKPDAMLREIDKKEFERSEIEEQLKAYSDRELLADTYKNITEEHIRSLLAGLADGLLANEKKESIKSMLSQFVDQVIIDPDQSNFTIHYRVAISGDKVASPRKLA